MRKKLPFLSALAIAILLLSFCKENEGPFNPDPRFSDSYNSRVYSIPISFRKLFSNDTVNFIFKNLENKKILEYSALIFDKGESGTDFVLSEEIPEGVYRLLAVDFILNSRDRSSLVRRGVGTTIEFTKSGASLRGKDKRDPDPEPDKLVGSGTLEDPLLINCGHDLKILQEMSNGESSSTFQGMYIEQQLDIDILPECDPTTGWVPINSYTNFPFKGCYDGGGKSISGLRIFHEDAYLMALFGCAEGAVIKNVNLINPTVTGYSCAASLLGSVFSSGSKRYVTQLDSITISGANITAVSGVSALVASVDQYSVLQATNISVTKSSVNGDYGVGGCVGLGPLYSFVFLDNALYDGTIASRGVSQADPISLFGGIVGGCDTLIISRSYTTGSVSVKHPRSDDENEGVGIGGLVGGCGMVQMTACHNYMSVSGHESTQGVGGLLGTTVIGSGSSEDGKLFNNAIVLACANEGAVTGGDNVGGIIGEGQGYLFYGYNTGNISSGRNAGGIIAESPSLIAHGLTNIGAVTGNENIGGIAGITPFNQFFLCNNYGAVTAQSQKTNLGGIAGTAGNNSAFSYSGNYGLLTNTCGRELDLGTIGGIAGHLGDPREYSDADIASIIFGILSFGFSFADIGFLIADVANVATKIVDAIGQIAAAGSYIGLTCDTYIGQMHAFDQNYTDGLKYEVEDITVEIDSVASSAFSSFKNTIKEGAYPIDASDVKKFAESQFNRQKELFDRLYNDDISGSGSLTEKAHQGIIGQKEADRQDMLDDKNYNTEVTSILSLVVTVLGIVATIVAAAWTGGAAFFASGAIIMGAIGGASGIAAGVCNFTENTSIVSQCFSMGDIMPGDGVNTGGIAGELGDNASIDNCYVFANLLDNIGNNAGGIAGTTGEQTEVMSSILFTDTWEYPQYGNWGGSSTAPTFRSLYISDNSSTYGKTKEDLYKKETYSSIGLNWDFWEAPNDKSFPYFKTSKHLVGQ